MNDNKNEVFVLSLLLAAILSFHIFIFDKIPLQFDELLMFDLFPKFSYENLVTLLLSYEVQMPLPYLMSKWIYEFFGESSLFLRLPSLIFTFCLSGLFYLLARFYQKRSDALKSTCLLLLFHPVVIFSGSMRPYVMMLFFQVLVFYSYKKFKNSNLTIVSLILLALIHPLGLLFSVFFAGYILFLKREKAPFYTYVSIALIVGILLIEYRFQGMRFVYQSNRLHLQFVDWIKRSSFILSGGIFSAFLLIVFGFFLKKKRSLRDLKNPYKIIFFWGFGLGALALLFVPDYFYPRHLIFCLPPLAILFVMMINELSEDSRWRNGIFALAIIILSYKSIVKEEVYASSYEIDSKAIAKKAEEISNNQLEIVNCGNCLSYYIKSEKLLCVNSAFKREFWTSKDDIVFVEFDYARVKCKMRFLQDLFDIEEEYYFKGAKVYKLKFRPI